MKRARWREFTPLDLMLVIAGAASGMWIATGGAGGQARDGTRSWDFTPAGMAGLVIGAGMALHPILLIQWMFRGRDVAPGRGEFLWLVISTPWPFLLLFRSRPIGMALLGVVLIWSLLVAFATPFVMIASLWSGKSRRALRWTDYLGFACILTAIPALYLTAGGLGQM
jgi:hypothetical protein